MPRVLVFACLLVLASQPVSAQAFIPLWETGTMPNSRGMTLEDKIQNERIEQVGVPGMSAFFPSSQENTGAAVLICPGGGYARLSYAVSGTQLAKWFNSMGVSAFVLNYRLPTSPDVKEPHLAPLQDAQQAMRVIRSRAGMWGIKPDRVGVLGTSAGGHLAATLGTSSVDAATAPNFMILVSPVISMGEYAHAGSRTRLLGASPSPQLIEKYSVERQVTSATPPAFLVHALDDKVVNVRNSLMFAGAMVEKNVSASLHVFPGGGHAIALRNNPGSTETWTRLCEMWLVEMGFITPVKK
ncbi:MAG: alpha/beta hydrolase [Segetibacter sp.]